MVLSNTHSGFLKPWLVANLMHILFSLHIHIYGKVIIYKSGTVRDYLLNYFDPITSVVRFQDFQYILLYEWVCWLLVWKKPRSIQQLGGRTNPIGQFLFPSVSTFLTLGWLHVAEADVECLSRGNGASVSPVQTFLGPLRLVLQIHFL